MIPNEVKRSSPWIDRSVLPEDEDMEQDDLLLLIQNLREKKALGCLSTLDKKLLKKITQTIRENPHHYSSKIGYL